ncbi:uncharacterized protein LOC119832985 [Zerene cesonia]|uniref:uncharacterized protein LOC119832985 n=1 Tax=Zerene cesonia TaxID=33412 RepID=UPI0018E5A785|nr:uncharacterized protein LOC119832985 [Zerene cesonia]
MFCEIPEFGRCCMCMPLRRGILTFGYINVLFAAFMIGVYSFAVHNDYGFILIYHGTLSGLEDEMCLILYLVDFCFGLALVYGAHTRHIMCLKSYYYYTLTTLLAMFILQVVGMFSTRYFLMWIMEATALFVTGFLLHIYLVLLVRSLLKKLENPGHSYENQLHQFVNGEIKIETNGVYPSTVIPNETV